jgi:glycosyltransferase involved in cell wall biosynthesis
MSSNEGVPTGEEGCRNTVDPLVSIVVPALNEALNLAAVLPLLPKVHEVILVDGGSVDGTVRAARRALPDIVTVLQTRKGKGNALAAGFARVTGDVVVMFDADGSADPAEIPSFVAALEAGADFAKGSRFLEGGGSADITPMRKVGNACLSGTANLLHGTRFTDLCYGYNAFWARCLPFISLDVAGFEVETLINLRIANAGMRITEVPSYEADRLHGETNLKTFRDGFRVLLTILGEWGHQHAPTPRGGRRADQPTHRQSPAAEAT